MELPYRADLGKSISGGAVFAEQLSVCFFQCKQYIIHAP